MGTNACEIHMKTRIPINQADNPGDAKSTLAFSCQRPGKLARCTALLGGAVAGILLAAQAAPAGNIFVIAMENHNFTQPDPTNSPQQILGNTAAPYINSLITPGHPNAAIPPNAATNCAKKFAETRWRGAERPRSRPAWPQPPHSATL